MSATPDIMSGAADTEIVKLMAGNVRLNDIKKRQIRRPGALGAGIATLLALAVSSCTELEVVLTHNMGWKSIPETNRMVGEQSAFPAEYADVIAHANTMLEEALISENFPAVSIAVGKDGELIWARSLGLRDLSSGEPAMLGTKFRIGSTAKALTGTIGAKLAEDGVLDLDRPIGDLVNYYPEKPYEITARQLFTHTAGLRTYEGGEYYSKKNHANVESAVGVFANSPLMFEPGTGFSYSTYGYVLASGVMEGATGLSFDSVVEGFLTGPLGMENTMREGLALGDFATPYQVRNNEYKLVFPSNNSNRTAGGGYVSTPTDLILMTQAIMVGEYLTHTTKETLFYTPQILANGKANEQNYALGWRHHPSESLFDGERKISITHHGGRAAGGDSFLVMYPEYDLSISIVTNRTVDDFTTLLEIVNPIAESIILMADNK